MEKETKYIRLDLQEVKESKTAFYRLTKELVDFLNLLEKDGDEIVGIELDRKEDNSFGYNIGFVVTDSTKKEDQPLERIPEETNCLPEDTNLFGKKVKVIKRIEGFGRTIKIGDVLLVKPRVYGCFELFKNKKRVMWGSNYTLIEMVNKGDMAVVGEEVKPPVEPILEENVSDGKKIEPLQNGERELKKLWLEELLFELTHFEYTEARLQEIVNKILNLLSQSKKESYQSGCEDMLRDTCAKIALFIESESGKSGRKEILEFIESLTNQKKEDEKIS